MILSQKQIEEIAAAVTEDFNKFFFGTESEEVRMARATPIDQFARDYLGLQVSFARLSSDGSICGLTAYTDTEYIVEEKGVRRTLPLRCNQVLLDESFIRQGQIKKLCGKRRFTLAHECAHQILYQMESDEVKQRCNRQYSARTAYSLRDLKTHEDWNEWQANVLGAAILMPQKEVDLAAWYFIPEKKLTSYGGYFTYRDRRSLRAICAQLGVSQSAAVIRLRQLGYLEDRPYSEFDDPTEVHMVTYDTLRRDAAINTYITRADESLSALGFTEHSFPHVCRVAELAEKRGVSMTEISLAWLLQKVAAPVVGATKLSHVEGAARSVELALSPEETAYLEELYLPHELVGVMAQNTPAASREQHVWSTGNQKIQKA